MPYKYREDKRINNRKYRRTERGKEVERRYRQRHWEEIKERRRIIEKKYRATNKYKVNRAAYVRRPEVIARRRERTKEWSTTPKGIAHRLRYRLAKMNLIQILGGKCSECGNNDFRVLEVAHRFNNGNVEREKHGKNGLVIYYNKHPDEAATNLLLLCGNCHNIRTYETYYNLDRYKHVPAMTS